MASVLCSNCNTAFITILNLMESNLYIYRIRIGVLFVNQDSIRSQR